MALRLILSGGIGSGKSTAARIASELGVHVIDADLVGHSVLASDGEAFEQVAELWPEVVVDGEIDRRALGRIVFSDPSRLEQLQAITHPAITSRIERLVDSSGSEVVLVELPLPDDLLGPGWSRIVVDAPDGVRRQRLLSRGMTDDEIRERMAAQPSRREWIELADHVLDNSGSVGELRAQTEALLARLREGSDQAPDEAGLSARPEQQG